jgi:hypothetical protein
MKKFVLILAAALLVSGGLFAQTSPDFSGPAPQFFSFDLGAGFGFAFDTDGNNGFGTTNTSTNAVGGVGNFGFKIEVLDNFSVGFDTLFSQVGYDGAAVMTNLFTGLRLSYNFIPQAGAAVGFGTTTIRGTTNHALTSAASLGFFGNFFQNRSASGITTGLRLRIDFVTPFDDLGAGKLVFTPAFNIGL